MTKRFDAIVKKVRRERDEVADRHGVDLPWATRSAAYPIASEADAKKSCRWATAIGLLTYADLLAEEVAEAIHAKTDEAAEEELIQVAALAIMAIEAIRRRRRARRR